MHRLAFASGALALAGGVRPAFAQDAPPYSIDIELLRPAFGQEGFVAVDVPIPGRSRTVRYGTVLQYEQAPLTLYEAVRDTELGAVVRTRFSAMAGASIDVERATFSVLVPAALNRGTDQEAFAADGFGLGDAGLGARLAVVRTPGDRFAAGLRAGLILPTGKAEAYMGEGRARFGAGALASLRLGEVTVASDLGVAVRPTVQTAEDFVASNELQWGSAARWRLPDATRAGLQAQLVGRSGLANFLAGGAENAVEALGGVELYPSRRATVGLSAGRGLTQGYGTTDLRVVTSLVVQAPPREPEPPPIPPPPPKPEAPALPDLDDPDPPDEVRQVGMEIFIPEMIQFVVDTNILLEESEDDLRAVADFINADARIASVVIEGHASREGDFAHNYALAESRARRIWEVLLEHGVAQERIAYRGLGEVVPIAQGDDEQALQQNRRVRFLVTRQLAPGEPPPVYPEQQVLPWSGATVPVVQPPPPEPPAAPDAGELDLDLE